MKIVRMSIALCIFFIGSLFFAFQLPKEKKSFDTVKLKAADSFFLEIKEPSDIIFNAASNSYFAVSDNGYIAELNVNGKSIRTSKTFGIDLEGLTIYNNELIVVDEMTRQFYKLSNDFSQIDRRTLTYNGGRNKGFESIAYSSQRHSFYTITEKDPVQVYELDTNFQVKREFDLPFKVRDVSAICFHENAIWILSDEDRTVFKCNPQTFQPIKAFLLPIINPEGITFSANGDLNICSDDLQKMYVFKKSDLE